MQRFAFFGLVVVIAAVSCGGQAASGAGTTQPAGAPSSGSGPACGLTFDPTWSPLCQARVDLGCCDQEKACAASATCNAIVQCIGAQPRPRDGKTAISGCLPKEPYAPEVIAGLKLFGALENCPNDAAIPYPKGQTCEWPTGDGT